MRLKPRGYNGAQSACADIIAVWFRIWLRGRRIDVATMPESEMGPTLQSAQADFVQL